MDEWIQSIRPIKSIQEIETIRHFKQLDMSGIMIEELQKGSEMTKIWANDITTKPVIMDLYTLKKLRDSLTRILDKHGIEWKLNCSRDLESVFAGIAKMVEPVGFWMIR